MLDQENLEKLEIEYYQNRKRYSILELEEIFPEAKEVIKEQIHETLLGLESAWKRIQSSVAHYQLRPEAEPICKATIDIIMQKEVYPLESRLKRLDYNLKVLERKEDDIDIEGLKDKNDMSILAVNNYGLKGNPSQKNMMVQCPFHKDKTPSMSISKRLFYCFSCGRSGDVITFLMEMENCEFKDAIKKL